MTPLDAAFLQARGRGAGRLPGDRLRSRCSRARRRRTHGVRPRHGRAPAAHPPLPAEGPRGAPRPRPAGLGRRSRTSTSATTCAGPRCPRPAATQELAALMGRVMSTPPRPRPPAVGVLRSSRAWPADRWALISKVHHCMVDGVSGTDLYRVVLDADPEPRPPVDDDWRPAPGALGPAAGGRRRRSTSCALPLGQARALARLARDPAALARRAGRRAARARRPRRSRC